MSLEPEKLSILILEDDATYSKLITTVLASSTDPIFQVTAVDSLKGALDALRDTEFDLIVADLNVTDSEGMPTFDGLHADSPDIPIMILSAHEADELAIQAVQSGAQDYISKQRVTPQALLRSVRYSIERSRHEQARLKLEAVQDFTQTLAHDMNVPLLGASRMFELLLDGSVGEIGDEQRKIIEVLQSSNGKLITLVNRLLEAYKYDALYSTLEFKTVDLEPLLRSCAHLAERESKSRGITITCHSDSISVKGNSDWLRTLFCNLLDNAVKFSPASSFITISASTDDDGKAYVAIEDQGHGLTTDQVLNFRRFWQGLPGKKYVAETGFGLFICHRIARAHRGKLRYDTATAGGSKFTVILPTA